MNAPAPAPESRLPESRLRLAAARSRIAAPVLERSVAVFAARADLPADRLAGLAAVLRELAADEGAWDDDDRVHVEATVRHRGLDVCAGPMPRDRARQLLDGGTLTASDPALGGRRADAAEISEDGSDATITLRFEWR